MKKPAIQLVLTFMVVVFLVVAVTAVFNGASDATRNFLLWAVVCLLCKIYVAVDQRFYVDDPKIDRRQPKQGTLYRSPTLAEHEARDQKAMDDGSIPRY